MELWQEIVELQKIGDCIKSKAKFMPVGLFRYKLIEMWQYKIGQRN